MPSPGSAPPRPDSVREVGISIQADAHEPHPWRDLNADEQAVFDRGYAVFNTEWVPANTPSGRIDGLGPLFSAHGCDACHNSRRRGRGPQRDGDAPGDLVIQLGRLEAPAGTPRLIARGSDDYGFVLSTSAVPGLTPEGRVHIKYASRRVTLADTTVVDLQQPHYEVDQLSGPALPSNTVLMPRLPPSAQGLGLLERVPQVELERIARMQSELTQDIRGRVAWLGEGIDKHIGRFGWQATEPTVASQVGVAFAREMGLTNRVVSISDCGRWNAACLNAPNGGSPEVEAELFEAVVAFEEWHAVPVEHAADLSSAGGQLFQSIGCGDCHRTTVRVELPDSAVIHPYTDLLLHDLGKPLADADLTGTPATGRWRTAPLWGLHAAYATGRPVRLLHDGRARSVEEAILWHDAEGRRARDNYARLTKEQRRTLQEWVESL
jgi:CxxC motif-containing protein (DUF1111 family)